MNPEAPVTTTRTHQPSSAGRPNSGSGTAAWTPTVWAPDAQRVDLHVTTPAQDSAGQHGGEQGSAAQGATVHAMQPDDRHGWWRAPVEVPHGTDYAFAVDGGDPRPDPRSPWQPHGVHGFSRAFDASRHAWQDAGWAGRDVRGAVVYEMHVGTFTPEGTLASAVERLDHLVDLGVDVVEIMPVAAFPGVHGWGYDGVCLYAVHEPYGGPAALQSFVDAAHRRGLAVCLDVVYNHLGPSGNYLGEFGPYFTDRHETPWGQAVNLDGPGSAEVRAFIVENALRWLRDFHIDALRIDAVHALVDDSPRHLLADLADATGALAAQVGRPLSLIAESDLNDVTMVTPTAEGGLGMTAQWADDVHHAIHAFMTGETHGYYADFASAEAVARVLTRVFLHDGSYSSFRGRTWGRPVPPDTDGHRFVVFVQDHDQVGNRAIGDRPSARLDAGGLAIEAALYLTSPFTPMLFMGEEWGATTPWQFFTDHAEPELVEGIRQGRTAEFGGHGWAELYGGDVEVPDPQAAETVADSRLDWEELTRGPHERLLAWYRDLIHLRRSVPDLASGDLRSTAVEYSTEDGWLVVRRGDVRVVIATAEEEVRVPLSATAPPQVLASWDGARVADDHVVLPGRSVAVLRLTEG